MNLKENAKKLADVGMEQGQKIIDKMGRDLVQEYIRPDISRVTVYNPDQGEIQYEQYIPFEMNRLDEMPEVSILYV